MPSVLLHARAPSIHTPCPACRGDWSTDGLLLLCLQILLYSLSIPLTWWESISAPSRRPRGSPPHSVAFLPGPLHPRSHQGSDAFTTLVCSAQRTGEPRSGFHGRRTHMNTFSLKTGSIFGEEKKKRVGANKKNPTTKNSITKKTNNQKPPKKKRISQMLQPTFILSGPSLSPERI